MPNEDGTLTQEELDSLSPSDRAHYLIKGRVGDGFSDVDGPEGATDASKTARAAAFELDNVQADGEDVDREARADALENAKRDAGVSGFEDEDSEAEGESPEAIADGVTGPEGSGHPQTEAEAAEAEAERREGMSEVERAEAEARDSQARTMPVEDHDENADVPNVGSRAPENAEPSTNENRTEE